MNSKIIGIDENQIVNQLIIPGDTKTYEFTNSGYKSKTITFSFYGQEMLRLEENGDIYVRGKLTSNDIEVVEMMKEFLACQQMDNFLRQWNFIHPKSFEL